MKTSQFFAVLDLVENDCQKCPRQSWRKSGFGFNLNRTSLIMFENCETVCFSSCGLFQAGQTRHKLNLGHNQD